MAKKKSSNIKALRKEAFLGSIKFYDYSKYKPKLLPIDHSKGRYQIQSRPMLVYWKWANPVNNKQASIPHPREATLYQHGFQISGITGTVEVLSWAYIPNKPITP